MGLDRAQVQSPSGLNNGEFLHDITSYSIFTSKYHVIASIGGVLQVIVDARRCLVAKEIVLLKCSAAGNHNTPEV